MSDRTYCRIMYVLNAIGVAALAAGIGLGIATGW
jgi:hypothetical protein